MYFLNDLDVKNPIRVVADRETINGNKSMSSILSS